MREHGARRDAGCRSCLRPDLSESAAVLLDAAGLADRVGPATEGDDATPAFRFGPDTQGRIYAIRPQSPVDHWHARDQVLSRGRTRAGQYHREGQGVSGWIARGIAR